LEAVQYLHANGITEGDAGYAVAAKVAEKIKVAKKGEVKVAGVKVATPTKAAPKVAA
jgi:uncharacterized protein YoaH (UPF0181 family)